MDVIFDLPPKLTDPILAVAVNSTYNVGRPQLRRIQEEMVQAALNLEQGGDRWTKLFEGSDFFHRHSNFLQITIRANNARDFLKWLRLCESRLRLLIASLETPNEVSAWPFAKFFLRKYTKAGVIACGDQESDKDCLQEALFFIALRFAPGIESVNLRQSTSEFLHKVNSWEERKEGMDLGIAHVLQSELPALVCANKSSRAEIALASVRAKRQHTERANGTRLTPKLARTGISDDDFASPSKRARSDYFD